MGGFVVYVFVIGEELGEGLNRRYKGGTASLQNQHTMQCRHCRLYGGSAIGVASAPEAAPALHNVTLPHPPPDTTATLPSTKIPSTHPHTCRCPNSWRLVSTSSPPSSCSAGGGLTMRRQLVRVAWFGGAAAASASR